MFSRIRLQNFKCFEVLDLTLNNLNVFSGINASGKSTVIQALLLIKQSQDQRFLLHNKLCLNGEYTNIGTGRDLLFENAQSDNIFIGLQQNLAYVEFDITYSEKNDMLDVKSTLTPMSEMLFWSGGVQYLNCERTSPQVVYPKSNYQVDTLDQIGINGQYSIHYLMQHASDALKWDSCSGKESNLQGAIQFWLNEITPNIKMDLQNVDNTDFARIGYYFTDKGKGNIFRPTNVGFGVSYALPVILALLKATEYDTVIIENPEAHLHPAGQRKMGELISMCAANGTQIFVETHSDHVLNGIRISVKKNFISHNKVGLYFFKRGDSTDKYLHVVDTPIIQENGKLDFWPDGFFDEWEKALDEII